MALRETKTFSWELESGKPAEGRAVNIARMSKPGSKSKKPSPFGKNLKALLEARGITQAQACALTGVSRSSLNQWLYASGSPRDLELAHRVVTTLDPSADFLAMLGLPPAKPATQLPQDLIREGFELENDPQFEGLFFLQMHRVRRRKANKSEGK